MQKKLGFLEHEATKAGVPNRFLLRLCLGYCVGKLVGLGAPKQALKDYICKNIDLLGKTESS